MNNFNYVNLTPFKWYVRENFPFIEAEFDAMTNWDLFCKLGKEINKIIDSQNLVGEQAENLTNAFNELQKYVNDFFEELNLQEEVNNKLDDMVTSGELAEIINEEIFSELNENINLLKNGFFTNGISVERKYNSATNTHYYITKIPKNFNGVSQNIQIGTAEDNITTYNKVEKPTDFAKRKNADLVINAGLFNTTTNEQYGIIIQNGQVIKNTLATINDTYYFCELENGRFTAILGTATAQELLNANVKNCILGWYPILIDGELTSYSSQEGAYGQHPRTIIAQTSDLDTIILSCNGRNHFDRGMDLHTIATILKEDYDCSFAFNLDGGGSTNLVVLENQITYNQDENFNTERKVPTFIYFKKLTTDNNLKSDLQEINKIQEVTNNNIIKSLIPDFLTSGNYKYYLNRLADCNQEGLKTGFYYVDSTTANYPSGYPTSLLFHYTWKSEIDNTQNLRQILICASENYPALIREKYSTGDWQDWHPFSSSYLTGAFNNFASLPSNFVEIGQMAYRKDNNKPMWYNGTKWVDAMNDTLRYLFGDNIIYQTTLLPNGQTFDDVMDSSVPSVFSINGTSTITSGKGFPTGAFGYGLLITLNSAYVNYKTQIYITDLPSNSDSGRGVYIRTRKAGNWLKLSGTQVNSITE